MLEWESPPSFVTGIQSATQLRVLKSDYEFLRGRADGPRAIFCGTYQKDVDGHDYSTIWEGRIRHQKNNFRYVLWVRGTTTKVKIIYDGNEILDASYTYSNWTIIGTGSSDTIDISGYELTADEWYKVSVRTRDGDQVMIAMLREEEAISGWLALRDFTSSGLSLDSNLNRISTDLTALKTVADGPGFTFIGIDNQPTKGTFDDIKYADDTSLCECYTDHYIWRRSVSSCGGCPADVSHSDTGDSYQACYFGGGFQCPSAASTTKLHFVFRAENVSVRIYCKAVAGTWDDNNIILDESYTTMATYEEMITLDELEGAETPSQGDYCAIRIQIRKDASGARFKLDWVSVFADEDLTPVENWVHGRGVDYEDLNTLQDQVTTLSGKGKLSHYLNQAVRRFTSRGYKMALQRRRGWRYLHYAPFSQSVESYDPTYGNDGPSIKYPFPSQAYDLIHHNLSWGDKDGSWDSEDIEKIDTLYYGIIYQTDDCQASQEWTDSA